MSTDDGSSSTRPGGMARRDFLRIGSIAGLAAGTALPQRLAAEQPATGAPPRFPVVDVTPLADLAAGASVEFTYPDPDSPAVLVRLSTAAEGGIGPGDSIVAFSLLCTHKGCPLSFMADRNVLICPCHWSSFDPAKAGRIVIGQASDPLPQITLRVADGMVQATGVAGLIYGRHTNII